MTMTVSDYYDYDNYDYDDYDYDDYAYDDYAYDDYAYDDYDYGQGWVGVGVGGGGGVGVGVGLGAGAGICLELEPEISKMGGSGKPAGSTAARMQCTILSFLAFAVAIEQYPSLQHSYRVLQLYFTLCFAFFPCYFTSLMPGSTNPMYFSTSDFPLALVYFSETTEAKLP